MKKKHFGHAVEIIAKQNYAPEQLFALLRQQGRFEGVPEFRTTFGVSAIFFPGTGGYENVMSVRGNKITLQQAKTTAKGVIKTLLLDWLTDNWSYFFNTEGGKNAAIMESIARETERLVK